MGQVHHGSATTTAAVRRAIQHSQESLRALAKRYGVDQKTVAKWRKRTSVVDLKTGPSEPKSTVLSVEDEAVAVAFRRHTLLPLDDCLYALQPTIPHLTRSSLHRCLQRHGISRLPDVEGDKPALRKFKRYPIGYFHIDLAEVRTCWRWRRPPSRPNPQQTTTRRRPPVRAAAGASSSSSGSAQARPADAPERYPDRRVMIATLGRTTITNRHAAPSPGSGPARAVANDARRSSDAVSPRGRLHDGPATSRAPVSRLEATSSSPVGPDRRRDRPAKYP